MNWNIQYLRPVGRYQILGGHSVEAATILLLIALDIVQNALQREWGKFPFANWNGFVEDFCYSLYNW